MQEISGKSGQSIYDVNLMFYAGFDNLIKFCKDSGISGLNDQKVIGKTLIIDDLLNNNVSTTTVIGAKGLTFATVVGVDGYRMTDEGDFRITDEGYIRILQ